MYNPNVIAIESLEVAKLLNNAILQSKSNEELTLSIPDLGFGEGSFITTELAEMYFETVYDWRSKNTSSQQLVFEILQKWMRYFRNELPEASFQFDLNIEDHEIFWDQEEGEILISGGETELNDDQISMVQDLYGIGRSMLQRGKILDKNSKAIKYFRYQIFYREKQVWEEINYLEKKGYKIEDIIDLDSVWVSGGKEELTEDELKKCAACFYIEDFSVSDPWYKPDGTISYELYYGPFFKEAPLWMDGWKKRIALEGKN